MAKSFTGILKERSAASSPRTAVTSDITPQSTGIITKSAGGRPTNRPRGSKTTTLHIDDDLTLFLGRIVHHRGKLSSMREVLNDGLRALVKADPLARQPAPGESAEQQRTMPEDLDD